VVKFITWTSITPGILKSYDIINFLYRVYWIYVDDDHYRDCDENIEHKWNENNQKQIRLFFNSGSSFRSTAGHAETSAATAFT
jgi:hypothetical protein